MWAESDLKRFINLYSTTPTLQLAKLLNRKVSSLHSKAKQLKLKKHPLYINNVWSPKTDKILKEMYHTHTSKEIGKVLGFSFSNVKNRAHKLGLGKKTNVGCFQKGHVPINKGKKMKPEVKEKVKHLFFQKGHKPACTLHDGAISTRKDTRSGITYKYIRISEGNWDLLHRVNYKKKFGDIPTTTFLRCKDGNQLNCDPSNWEPIDMNKNMDLNRIHQYPKELQEAIKLNNKLKKEINARY